MGLLDVADGLIDQFQNAYDAGRYAGDAVVQRTQRVANIFKGDSLSSVPANPVQVFQEPVPGFGTQMVASPTGSNSTLLIVAVAVVAIILLGD